MLISGTPARISLLIVVNAPIVTALGCVLFSDWTDFKRQFIPEVDFDFLSWVTGIHLRWQNWRLCFLLLLYAGLVVSEYHVFWGLGS